MCNKILLKRICKIKGIKNYLNILILRVFSIKGAKKYPYMCVENKCLGNILHAGNEHT